MGLVGDLDLAIDLSTSLYTPTVHLVPSSSEDDGSYSDILVSLIDQDRLVADEELFKQTLMVRYPDLPAGEYKLILKATQESQYEVKYSLLVDELAK